ncbi:hypothetical protein EUX98_g6384 [Antrodiella citrinella]|uniref:Uncharacterized protein n=1 Tax=Antrodiella citrinella TaxID=2447956 RepID=A0A4S4MP37_9APHY|nr:hypothetical protein EUX98_g6384 [Antrodiella citrinella]
MQTLRPRPQWARLVQPQYHARRLQSTSWQSFAEPSFGQSSKAHKRKSKGAIFVRIEHPAQSMLESFAIVRGIEKKLGRLRDYQILRDQGDPTIFRDHFYAEFEDEHNFQALPSEPITLSLKVPKLASKPGGLSLVELRGYLLPEDKSVDMISQARNGEEEQGEHFVVDVRIEKAYGNVHYKVIRPYHRMGKKTTLLFGHEFFNWGGFYDPSRMDPPETSMHLENRMGKVLSAWDVALKKEEQRNPTQIKPPAIVETDDTFESAAEASPDTVEPPVDVAFTHLQTPEPSIPIHLVPSLSRPQHTSIRAEILAGASEEQNPSPPVSSSPPPSPTPSSKPLSRKERILAQTRENARKALSEADTPGDQAAKAGETPAEPEPEPEKKGFWRLMGFKW